MIRRVLIPLDGSKESEGVWPAVREEVDPEALVILMRVIRPHLARVVGGLQVVDRQLEEKESEDTLAYLRRVTRDLGGDPDRWDRWRCTVVMADSVAQGIVESAQQYEVDLIAMYSHDRKGLARLINRAVAAEVQRRAPMAVRVLEAGSLLSSGA